jgi:hypothetical protein
MTKAREGIVRLMGIRNSFISDFKNRFTFFNLRATFSRRTRLSDRNTRLEFTSTTTLRFESPPVLCPHSHPGRVPDLEGRNAVCSDAEVNLFSIRFCHRKKIVWLLIALRHRQPGMTYQVGAGSPKLSPKGSNRKLIAGGEVNKDSGENNCEKKFTTSRHRPFESDDLEHAEGVAGSQF